jgi:hypothetical protein
MLPTSLSEFGGPSRESGDNIVFQICPVCGSNRWKTYVNPQTGGWYCHAPEHSGGGVVDVGIPTHERGAAILDQLCRANPAEKHAWVEVGLPAWEPLSAGAVRYLARRGITPEHATRLGLVEMEDRMRVVVPYFGPSGEIIYWNARSYSNMEEGPKYLAASGKHPLYIRPSWRPSDTVVLVEGVFDAINVEKHTGLAVAAIGGKALPSYLYPDLLDMASDRIVVLLDSDAFADALKLRQKLVTKRHVEAVWLPVGLDPADLTGDELRELLC